jgi:8-oxo-dGTP pyrophosphatase MutT (NUDIX family)
MAKPVPTGDSFPKVQLAAGGIVWQDSGGDAKLALVHRPKYDDWTLPKGKPEAGETLAETARREVLEEIGHEVRMLEFAGVLHYPLREQTTKVVLFWHMLVQGGSSFRPNREIDAMVWLTPAEAMQKLTHKVEVELLRGLQSPQISPPA